MQVYAMINIIDSDREERSDNKYQSSQSAGYEKEPVPVDPDQGPVLIVIALVVFVAVLVGLFATTTLADEAVDASVTEIKSPATDWKPPVSPKIIIHPPIDAEQSKKIIEQWGVEIISLNLTAAGYMMDFRYRVHDVEKSKIFFDSRIKPYLHVEKSNAKLPVPMAAKVGAFRPTNRGKNIKPNKIDFPLSIPENYSANNFQ